VNRNFLDRLLGRLLADYEELLARSQAQTSLAAYIDFLDFGLRPARHHSLLIEHLEAVERGEIPRLMVCMPPGSAKSTYVSCFFPAWYIGRQPDRSIIGLSYNDDLAWRFGRKVRNLVGSPEHRAIFGTRLASDIAAAGEWETTEEGEYYAAGILGSMAGRRADLGIIDDPIRSRQSADSDVYRERIWDAYVNDFVPRLKPGASRIMVTTRWHEDDLAGRCLGREPGLWHLLSLPMEAMPNDPLGRAVGERLWPEWFTEDMVVDAKRDARSWNALYQQQPAALEGDYFKFEWFRDYDELPGNTVVYGASDYAVSEGAGDYTEHGIFAVDHQANLYVVDWWRDQATADVWIERQCDLILRHSPLIWFGESGPIKRAVEPFLLKRMNDRRAFCRLEWLPSISEKTVRCRPFQALCSMGKVFFPRNTPWKADLIGQLLRFPAGRYDDGVDVCSLIGRGLEHVRPPRIAKSVEHRQVDMSREPSNKWMAG
jgi:predicted phage terminase large subunit-like protein